MEMNMNRVSFDDLLYEDDGIYSHEGAPFSGVACDVFPNGKVRSEAQFVDGHQEGVAKEWYDNGQIKFERMYLGDGLHGVSKEWHPNGQLKEESECEFGICLESKEWDDGGLLTKRFNLQPTDVTYQMLMTKRSILGPERVG
jgi:antitoxin component YwqK of YwqJK toxin-antitoxin module